MDLVIALRIALLGFYSSVPAVCFFLFFFQLFFLSLAMEEWVERVVPIVTLINVKLGNKCSVFVMMMYELFWLFFVSYAYLFVLR